MNNDTLVFRRDCEVYSISFRLLDNVRPFEVSGFPAG